MSVAVSSQVRWAKVIDQTRCIGCHACSTACKSENLVPLSVNRTYVKYADVGVFPQARRAMQVTRCNQCEAPPCAEACPTGAMYQRPDGIVDFDKAICIGCKACIAACPYDAIFINPEDHSAEKCNFCAHRVDSGLEPACVVVCPTEAIYIGDLNDPSSRVAKTVNREPVLVRRPEKDTGPKLFYKGVHQATLDPIAARRPEGGLFLWSEQGSFPQQVTSGHPAGYETAAAALLSYDVPHRAPWDFRVSLYTWTKGIASGAYLVAAILVLMSLLSQTSPLWVWGAPVASGLFLALTGGLLIWDLEHPERFFMIFTHGRWQSWLVKGAYILGGFGLVLAAHFLASLTGSSRWLSRLMLPGIPLAILTAIYTAYLFAQAKARDLWQNPLLPPQFVVHCLLAGSAILVPVSASLDPAGTAPLLRIVAVASFLHLFLVWGEATLAHVTAHARLAAWEMTRGRFRFFFWASVALVSIGIFAPRLGAVAAVAALAGLLLYEHAHVQAAQSVPLA
ncbi:MAG TPA: 4Fe-4S dicluster domain-containing protein [Vicinamibacteria bacterium]|nr:4Fe-4S dicluster domain-containing protein [Vicinamibacteria bacterium]